MSRKAIETAISWRTSLDSGEVSPDEREAFFRWLEESPEHAEAFEHVEAFWQGLGDLPAVESPNELYLTKAAAPTSLPRREEAPRSAGFALAASILVAVSLLLILIAESGMFQTLEQLPGVAYVKHETGVGEIRDLKLADGSAVTLGAASAIRVRTGDGAREVIVQSGDVFFDVAPDPRHPFSVVAGTARIAVVGTAFEVRRSLRSVNVAVAEGVVAVSSKSALARDALRSGEIQLTAGEGIAAYKGVFSPVRAVNTSQIGAWRQQRLVYHDATLARIIADANRYDARNISLQGEAIKGLTITATFDFGDIDQVLTTLTEVFPLEVDHISASQVLISPRD